MIDTDLQFVLDSDADVEFATLVVRHLADDLSGIQRDRLNVQLTESAEKREEFVAICIQSRLIATRTRMELALQEDFGGVLVDGQSASGHARRDASPSPAPALGFLSSTIHGTIGYSSGWPLAYAIATVVTGLWLLSFWLMPVSRPEQVVAQSLPPAAERQIAPEPLPASVGRITGIVDCKSADPGMTSLSAAVRLGQKYELASGLMEITYDTGAKVILQGPVTYSVEANGGYLAVGKLTGKLETKAQGPRPKTQEADIHHSSFILHPFSIHTPTATVTDLGTEFGVEVKQDGGSEVHVLAGEVELATKAGSGRCRLIANSPRSAARVEAGTRKIVGVSIAPERFLRAMPPRVIVEWSGCRPQSTFSPAKDDLLQTSLASASTDDGPPPFGFQSLSCLYDGTMYGPNNEDQGIDNSHHGFVVRDGKSITFTLDTSRNKQGYTIKSIDVYTGYFWYRIGQKYKVEFGRVGQKGWLPSPVVAFGHRALRDPDIFEEACSHICNRVPNEPLAADVDRIRFTFYDQTEGLTADEQRLDSRGVNYGTGVYREIDVFGVPSSEALTLGPSPATGEGSGAKDKKS